MSAILGLTIAGFLLAAAAHQTWSSVVQSDIVWEGHGGEGSDGTGGGSDGGSDGDSGDDGCDGDDGNE